MTAYPELKSLEVLGDAGRLSTALPPIRRRILENLDAPESASGLARRLGLPRQRVNYHVRELERAGLIECVERNRRRGCIERKLRVAARAFVISPLVLGRLNADPETVRDRFSSTYLIAAASRIIGDVGMLRERADAAGKRLTTLTMETEVSIASPADLSAFTAELAATIEKLATMYHRPGRPGSRPHRFMVAGHPVITKTPSEAAAEARRRHGRGKKEDR